jgi:hypothetical protein
VDINAALNGLSFLPAANYTGAASLQITTSDQGNIGSGGALGDTDTVNITVGAVNEPPTMTVPGPQLLQRSTLVFSAASGNAIVLGDPDAGSAILQLTLVPTNGLLTLGSTAGIAVVQGTGVSDSLMIIRGTLGDLNRALDGLVFQPTTITANLNVIFSDLGTGGLGGPLTVSERIDIMQIPLAPPAPPTDGGNGGGNGNGNGNGGTNNPQQPSTGGTITSPITTVMPIPAPRVADDGQANRYSSARLLAGAPTDNVVLVAVAGPARTFRALSTDFNVRDDNTELAPDLLRKRTVELETDRLLASVLPEQMLWDDLRQMNDALDSTFSVNWTFGAVAGLGAISAGYMLWGLQAGSLVTSALSSLPVWGSFDPLPVLEFWERDKKRKGRDRDEEDPFMQPESDSVAV